MDPVAVQFANFSISNNNKSSHNNKTNMKTKNGHKTTTTEEIILTNGMTANAAGIQKSSSPKGNDHHQKHNNDGAARKNNVTPNNIQRKYVENLAKLPALGGNKHIVQSLIEAKAAVFMNNAVQYPSAGSSGGGDAPFINGFAGAPINAFGGMNLPRFMNEPPYRDMGFEFAANFQFSESARKQLLDRQFRQVEMGSPAGSDYSRKVFVGGLPPDIFESSIKERFSEFGTLSVDWPHKQELNSIYPPKGYAFLLYNEDSSVRRLINACSSEEGRLFICVSSQTMKDKPVQVRPWRVADADYVPNMNINLDPRKTVFIGGVPRPIRAYDLAVIMNRLFGGVCYAGIDTDNEFKYPKGAGRVTFYSHQSYVAAISARFVQLQHEDIDKRVEIKPYVLDDQQCDECHGKSCNYKYARFFCSNVTCLRYFCDECWQLIHANPGREYHKPLVKEGNERPRAVPYRWRTNKN